MKVIDDEVQRLTVTTGGGLQTAVVEDGSRKVAILIGDMIHEFSDRRGIEELVVSLRNQADLAWPRGSA